MIPHYPLWPRFDFVWAPHHDGVRFMRLSGSGATSAGRISSGPVDPIADEQEHPWTCRYSVTSVVVTCFCMPGLPRYSTYQNLAHSSMLFLMVQHARNVHCASSYSLYSASYLYKSRLAGPYVAVRCIAIAALGTNRLVPVVT